MCSRAADILLGLAGLRPSQFPDIPAAAAGPAKAAKSLRTRNRIHEAHPNRYQRIIFEDLQVAAELGVISFVSSIVASAPLIARGR